MSDLQPLPGFDWTKVKWGAPTAAVTEVCSYCGERLSEEGVPLRCWNQAGWACAFCETCMQKWWGLESYAEPDEDAEGREP
ncbi:MAG: hypothetical protein JXA90_03180 [Planctomycetes bacterium]|nr:hypothetical protein [Planctomycetota bacterium]